MALRAVVFDMGETLVDETRSFEQMADRCGVPRFTLAALAGAAIAQAKQPQDHVFEWLGVERAYGDPFTEADLYPDALPCIDALRAREITVGVVGNMGAVHESFIAAYVDWVGSSERWGVSKPDPRFFSRIVDELALPVEEVAYVGDRVDNDVAPALAAGMTAVHIRRGPWGYLHETPTGARRIESLMELLA
jgi:HAD superfamily hydrolase (TIGR01549 family)